MQLVSEYRGLKCLATSASSSALSPEGSDLFTRVDSQAISLTTFTRGSWPSGKGSRLTTDSYCANWFLYFWRLNFYFLFITFLFFSIVLMTMNFYWNVYKNISTQKWKPNLSSLNWCISISFPFHRIEEIKLRIKFSKEGIY